MRKGNNNYAPNVARIHETLELLETNPMMRTKEEMTQKERTKFGLFNNSDIGMIGSCTRNDDDLDETILVAYRKAQVPSSHSKEFRKEEPFFVLDPPD